MNSTDKIDRRKNYFLELIVIIMAAVFIELFGFQFRVWQDLNNQEIQVPLELGTYTEATALRQDGSVLFDQGNGDCRVQFDLRSLEHCLIRNISVKVFTLDGETYWDNFEGANYAVLRSGMVNVRMVLTEGNKNILLEPGIIGADASEADILALPAGSRPDLITIQFESLMGQHMVLSEIRLNVARRIRFSMGRFLTILAFMLFVRCLLPKSRLWKNELRYVGKWKLLGWEVFFGIFVSWVMILLILHNPVYIQGEGGFAPYRELTHALAKGQTFIEEEPSAELLALNNPYDFLERMESGVKYKLDYALYQGKYYVYFGIIPCLFFFLPAYMVAGIDVPGWMVIAFLLIVLYIGMGALLKTLAARYRKNLSVAGYILLRVGMLSVLSLPAMMSDPNAYYIPMLSATVFYVFSCICYLQSAEAMDAGKKEIVRIAVASLFMAFVAGCRPQLVLAAIAVLPVMIRYLFEKKEKHITIRWKRCIAFVTPYIVVAIGLMYYNAIRFGSPFDFGASYNLTFANTYNWEFHTEAVGAGILYYLLRIPKWSTGAPFLMMTHLEWSNPGLLANHTSTGGVYALYPILWVGILNFVKRKNAKSGKAVEIRWMGCLWLGLTVFMAAMTAAAGGLMDRYRLDCTIFASLAMCAGVLVRNKDEAEKAGGKEEKTKRWGKTEWLHVLMVAGVLLAVVISVLTYLEDGVWWIADANPEWYARWRNAIAFWR